MTISTEPWGIATRTCCHGNGRSSSGQHVDPVQEIFIKRCLEGPLLLSSIWLFVIPYLRQSRVISHTVPSAMVLSGNSRSSISPSPPISPWSRVISQELRRPRPRRPRPRPRPRPPSWPPSVGEWPPADIRWPPCALEAPLSQFRQSYMQLERCAPAPASGECHCRRAISAAAMAAAHAHPVDQIGAPAAAGAEIKRKNPPVISRRS